MTIKKLCQITNVLATNNEKARRFKRGAQWKATVARPSRSVRRITINYSLNEKRGATEIIHASATPSLRGNGRTVAERPAKAYGVPAIVVDLRDPVVPEEMEVFEP